MGTLSGRSALVTGAGRRRGIGFAIASRLVQAGQVITSDGGFSLS